MTSDGSTDTNPNPEPDPEGSDQGGGTDVSWDKVAEVLKAETGLDLKAEIATREQAASKVTAEEVGRKAQSTYDPKIAELQKALEDQNTELGRLRADTQVAKIAALPKEQREQAQKLFDNEETVRQMAGMQNQLNAAAKVITAEKMVLELGKKGIEVEVEEFLKIDSATGMEVKAGELELAETKRLLEEAKKGSEKPKDKEEEAPKEPPAASRQQSQQGAPRGRANTGAVPWEEQKGSGFKNLGAAIGKLREAN